MPDRGQLMVLAAGLESGFIMPSLQVAVISERNLVPRRRKRKSLGQRQGVNLRDYLELSIGDYVVHEQHGIGKYLGLSTLEINGLQKDYLQVKYRGADKLYIPVEQVQLIQKYIRGGPVPARITWAAGVVTAKIRLTPRSGRWPGTLNIYARRQAPPGYALGPIILAARIRGPVSYEETPDQLSDCRVKRTWRNQTMDRLMCGDVGYGKPKWRCASFKAAVEGKQAFLVPPPF